MREVERAISHEIPVIPFRIEDVQPSEDIAYFISSIHWLDALTPPLERHAQQLADTVRRFLTEKAEPQPSAMTPEPPPAAEPESPTVKPTPKPSTAVGRGTQIAASVGRGMQIAASVRRAQQIAAAVRKAQQAAAEPEPPTSKPTPEPAPATEPAAPPPSFDLLSTFLADARQTQADLATVEAWFDQLAGGETVAGSGVLAHSIHLPVSVAPGQDPDLADMWDKYHAAIADGQQCLQWLIDFCASGGGTMDDDALRVRRELLSSALRHAEHVVQALEALQ
jgi:hypothetical protein